MKLSWTRIFSISFPVKILFIQVTQGSVNTRSKLAYPKAKHVSKTYTYFSNDNGKNVSFDDPFAWLENNPKSDTDVRKFISEQNNLTERYLDQCQNQTAIKTSIQNALNGFDDYYDFYFINQMVEPSFYLYSYREANQSFKAWYKCEQDEMRIAKKANLRIPPGIQILNEKEFNSNGKSSVKVSSVQISSDGSTLAYLLMDETFGQNKATWHFRLVDNSVLSSKNELPDMIPNGTGNLVFINNDRGFIYAQITQTKEGLGSIIRYHQMNTSTEDDCTIFIYREDIYPDYWSFDLSDDEDWLFVTGTNTKGTGTKVYATYLPDQTMSENMKWICISPSDSFTLFHLTVIDGYWYVQTNKDAVNSKIAKVRLD